MISAGLVIGAEVVNGFAVQRDPELLADELDDLKVLPEAREVVLGQAARVINMPNVLIYF